MTRGASVLGLCCENAWQRALGQGSQAIAAAPNEGGCCRLHAHLAGGQVRCAGSLLCHEEIELRNSCQQQDMARRSTLKLVCGLMRWRRPASPASCQLGRAKASTLAKVAIWLLFIQDIRFDHLSFKCV